MKEGIKMAKSLMINVPQGFSVEGMCESLRDMYQAKGFSVNIMTMNNAVRMQFDKGCGGINMILGMGKGITATCVHQNNNLIVNYSDEEWTGKIIGLCIGWVLCFIPFITAIIGCINQSSLSKDISNDITMIVANT